MGTWYLKKGHRGYHVANGKRVLPLNAIMLFDHGPNIHRGNRVGSFHLVVKVTGGDLP